MLNLRVLLTLELMWLNHSWWATDGIHCRKKLYSFCDLKWQGIQFATCGVTLLLLFSCQTSLSTCIHSEKSAHLSRFHSTVKITCMRTDYAQSTCQTLKFQFEQQVTPSFLRACIACVVLLLRGPAAIPPVLVGQELSAWAWESGLLVGSSGFLEGFVLV